MRTPHHPTRPETRTTTRCLRHRVWMAACLDCRAAHSATVRDEPQPAEPSTDAA
ncbi:hypothetical protein ACI784_19720 [Geodermatophilus sp. SYSU D01186]